MSATKDLQRLVRYAGTQGFLVSDTGGGHTRLLSPNGTTVIVPSTPSDYRGYANCIAQLRRAGLAIPRKAPKPRPKRESMASTILDNLPFEVTLEMRPHITAILGQWRSPSWFEEDGQPRSEYAWPGLTRKEMLAGIVCSHIEAGPATVVGEAIVSSYTEKQEATLPTGRRLRIQFDSLMFWAAGDLRLTNPSTCSCGKQFSDEDNWMVGLATHIVVEHERGHTNHEPADTHLKPWEDPDEVELLLQADAYIEAMVQQVEQYKQKAEKFVDKYTALKRAMRAALDNS